MPVNDTVLFPVIMCDGLTEINMEKERLGRVWSERRSGKEEKKEKKKKEPYLSKTAKSRSPRIPGRRKTLRKVALSIVLPCERAARSSKVW